MKMVKKLATLLLAVCLVVPCFSMVSYAKDGDIQFEDPSTTVGETLEFNLVIKKSSGTMGKIEIIMQYDTEYLKFKSGDGIVENTSGEITYTADLTNESGSRKEVAMKFDVLKAGQTKLTIKDSTVKDVSGTVKDYAEGSATITIAEGEVPTVTEPGESEEPAGESGEGTVEIGGKTYTISNEIPENEIPEGYETSSLEYDLVNYNVVYSEDFQLKLAYLVREDGLGDFFMYMEEDATFAPYIELELSDVTRIALLSDVSEVILPSEYSLDKDLFVYDEYIIPGWTCKENAEYSILYAINNSGEKLLYQYDNLEKTYQRFEAPEVETEKVDDSFIGKLSSMLQNHMDYVILGTGLGFILFIIIIVILSVKLYNRNAELDEIYDEYGLDDLDDKSEVYDYEDEEDYYDDEEDDTDGDREMEMLVQAGLTEVFPEEDEVVEEPVKAVAEEPVKAMVEEPIEEMVVEPVSKVTSNTVEIPIERVVEKVVENEDTLGEALAKQREEDYYDDDEEDVLDNFSMDFIDLDD